MARNVEIKAHLVHIETIAPTVAALADAGPTFIAQDDTFFHCPNGRLKLRVFAGGRGELIAYERSDTAGPKLSNHVRAEVADPDALREALTRACGQRGRVVKQRTLYLVGATRVHLDVVQGLGHFLELEVVLRDNETVEQGQAVARGLLETLGLGPDQLVPLAYIDLLLSRS